MPNIKKSVPDLKLQVANRIKIINLNHLILNRDLAEHCRQGKKKTWKLDAILRGKKKSVSIVTLSAGKALLIFAQQFPSACAASDWHLNGAPVTSRSFTYRLCRHWGGILWETWWVSPGTKMASANSFICQAPKKKKRKRKLKQLVDSLFVVK